MNRNEHLLISGFGTFLIDAIKQNQKKGFVDLKQSFVSGIFGAIGGLIPDQLEPATNPNHRGPFHSWGMMGLTIIGENKLKQNEQIDLQLKKAILDISLGYKLHLAVDATTHKRLPFI